MDLLSTSKSMVLLQLSWSYMPTNSLLQTIYTNVTPKVYNYKLVDNDKVFQEMELSLSISSDQLSNNPSIDEIILILIILHAMLPNVQFISFHFSFDVNVFTYMFNESCQNCDT